MDAFKKFLNKKKADSKFKAAGPGHRLTADASSTSKNSAGGRPGGQVPQQQKSKPTPAPSDEKRQAAMAALARIEKEKSKKSMPDDLLANRQLAFIKGI